MSRIPSYRDYKSIDAAKADLVVYEREFFTIAKKHGKHTEQFKHAEKNVKDLKYIIKNWDKLTKGK